MARVEKYKEADKVDEVEKGRERGRRDETYRKSKPWLTCSLVGLVVVLGVLVWGVWIVAATGLVRVPVFTDLAYEEPQPTREVSSGVPVETVLQETFTSTRTRRLYEGSGALQNRSIEAVVSEESLTASIRTLAEESDFTWLNASDIQIVIDPEVGMEVFTPLDASVSELHTAIITRFHVQANDGVIEVTPTSVMVGDLNLPKFVVATFLKPILGRELAKMNQLVVGYARISEIEIGSGQVAIKGELSVEIEQ